MDLATLIGVLAGVGLLVITIVTEGRPDIFIHPRSLMIVIGGTVAATFVHFPMTQIKQVISLVRVVFGNGKAQDPAVLISTLVNLAEKARREGLLALEDDLAQESDPFLIKGIQLVVDGTDPELVRSILEIDLNFLEDRHRLGQGVFKSMGVYAPAFGMIGTLIGLVGLLSTLDNPDAIAGGMSTALLTTLYGTVLANLFFIPIAGKLAFRTQQEIHLKQLTVEGILSIQAGENPRIVEEKLKAFLAPSQRETSAAGGRQATESVVSGRG